METKVYNVLRKYAQERRVKLYLDDERKAPPGWTLIRWPEDVIGYLKRDVVDEISLDHDLGDDAHGTGYDVIKWIEEAVVMHHLVPPKIKVHSANTSARIKMELGIKSILKQHENNQR